DIGPVEAGGGAVCGRAGVARGADKRPGDGSPVDGAAAVAVTAVCRHEVQVRALPHGTGGDRGDVYRAVAEPQPGSLRDDPPAGELALVARAEWHLAQLHHRRQDADPRLREPAARVGDRLPCLLKGVQASESFATTPGD